jgi:hypothetical protein
VGALFLCAGGSTREPVQAMSKTSTLAMLLKGFAALWNSCLARLARTTAARSAGRDSLFPNCVQASEMRLLIVPGAILLRFFWARFFYRV